MKLSCCESKVFVFFNKDHIRSCILNLITKHLAMLLSIGIIYVIVNWETLFMSFAERIVRFLDYAQIKCICLYRCNTCCIRMCTHQKCTCFCKSHWVYYYFCTNIMFHVIPIYVIFEISSFCLCLYNMLCFLLANWMPFHFSLSKCNKYHHNAASYCFSMHMSINCLCVHYH